MKNNLVFLLFILFTVFACKRDRSTRPSTLHLSGIVSDKQTSASLDSVTITIYYTNGIGLPSIPFQNFSFSNDKEGKFNYQFSPEPKDGNTYQLRFAKKGYCYSGCQNVSIDRDKEFQEFNVYLEK